MAHSKRRLPGAVLARRTIKKVRRRLLWDCSSCNTVGIGAHSCKQCPHCGSPKELDDHREAEYRSASLVNKNYKHKGADISCQSCGTENKKRFSCRNCGDALDSTFAKQVKHFPLKSDSEWRDKKVQVTPEGYVSGATDTPWNAGSSATVPEPPKPLKPSIRTRARGTTQKVVRATASLKQPEVRRNPKTWCIICGVIFAVLVVILIALWAHKKYTTITESSATVSEVQWTYSLPLEDLDWRDKVHKTSSDTWRPPASAINKQDKPAVVDTELVTTQVWVEKTCTTTEDNSYNDDDGTWVELITEVDYDCSGNEDKTVSVDIWGTRWEYQMYEWEQTVPLTASGKTHDVRFPVFIPTNTLRASGEAITSFSLLFQYEDQNKAIKTDTRRVLRNRWKHIKVDDSFPALVDGFGTLRAIKNFDDKVYKSLSLGPQ
jgi:hypothetical protein